MQLLYRHAYMTTAIDADPLAVVDRVVPRAHPPPPNGSPLIPYLKAINASRSVEFLVLLLTVVDVVELVQGMTNIMMRMLRRPLME